MSEGTNLRVFQVDEHVFRIDIDRPNAPAEMLREGEWVPVVLTADEVKGLIHARELVSDEIEALDLPD